MNGSNLDGGSSPAGVFSSAKIGKLGYAIGIFVGLLFLITTITLASYFCSRVSGGAIPPTPRRRRRRSRAEDEESGGVDDETLKSWPEVTYAEARRIDPRAAGCCSVCLADFGEDDAGEALLRLLPECGHLFHAACVDRWLRRRPTCPVCRWSPAPTPMPTPLAEIVPLATSS